MESVTAFFSRSGRLFILRTRLRALERERMNHLLELGRKVYELWKKEELTSELIKEECQGVMSVEEEVHSLNEQMQKLRKQRDYLVCSSCGKRLLERQRYCPACGFERSPARSCSNCGEEVNEEDLYCGKCGASLEEERRNDLS